MKGHHIKLSQLILNLSRILTFMKFHPLHILLLILFTVLVLLLAITTLALLPLTILEVVMGMVVRIYRSITWLSLTLSLTLVVIFVVFWLRHYCCSRLSKDTNLFTLTGIFSIGSAFSLMLIEVTVGIVGID